MINTTVMAQNMEYLRHYGINQVHCDVMTTSKIFTLFDSIDLYIEEWGVNFSFPMLQLTTRLRTDECKEKRENILLDKGSKLQMFSIFIIQSNSLPLYLFATQVDLTRTYLCNIVKMPVTRTESESNVFLPSI